MGLLDNILIVSFDVWFQTFANRTRSFSRPKQMNFKHDELQWRKLRFSLDGGGEGARHLMKRQKVLPSHQNCDAIYFLV